MKDGGNERKRDGWRRKKVMERVHEGRREMSGRKGRREGKWLDGYVDRGR